MSQMMQMYQQVGPAQFSTLIGQVAPYFASIAPQFVELRPGYAEVTFPKRREVLNHIGTVHAIALCNAAELAAGTMTDASIPAGCRWIPRGMTVDQSVEGTVANWKTENSNWKKSPDDMLVYRGTRQWARRYAPACPALSWSHTWRLRRRGAATAGSCWGRGRGWLPKRDRFWPRSTLG